MGNMLRRFTGAARPSTATAASSTTEALGAMSKGESPDAPSPGEPSVEIIDSQTRYGRLLGGATSEYILRLYLRFSNGTQQPVSVKSLNIALDGKPLNRLFIPGPSFPILLTSKGQEGLHTNKVYSTPYTLPSTCTQERYAFFQLPANFPNALPRLQFTATVIFSKGNAKEISFTVNR